MTTYRRKPPLLDEGMITVEQYSPPLSRAAFGRLQLVARLADDSGEVHEVTFKSGKRVLLAWYTRTDDYRPSRPEYTTVEPGGYLAYSHGEGFLFASDDQDLRHWYEAMPDGQELQHGRTGTQDELRQAALRQQPRCHHPRHERHPRRHRERAAHPEAAPPAGAQARPGRPAARLPRRGPAAGRRHVMPQRPGELPPRCRLAVLWDRFWHRLLGFTDDCYMHECDWDREPIVTKTGKRLTAADIKALADEAERGYDL